MDNYKDILTDKRLPAVVRGKHIARNEWPDVLSEILKPHIDAEEFCKWLYPNQVILRSQLPALPKDIKWPTTRFRESDIFFEAISTHRASHENLSGEFLSLEKKSIISYFEQVWKPLIDTDIDVQMRFIECLDFDAYKLIFKVKDKGDWPEKYNLPTMADVDRRWQRFRAAIFTP